MANELLDRIENGRRLQPAVATKKSLQLSSAVHEMNPQDCSTLNTIAYC